MHLSSDGRNSYTSTSRYTTSELKLSSETGFLLIVLKTWYVSRVSFEDIYFLSCGILCMIDRMYQIGGRNFARFWIYKYHLRHILLSERYEVRSLSRNVNNLFQMIILVVTYSASLCVMSNIYNTAISSMIPRVAKNAQYTVKPLI